jgi:hypothetical protein
MTDIQKQCLLKYLGYYQGQVDGIFGKLSQQATKDFQADYGLENSGVFDSATEETILQALAGGVQKVADPWEGIQYFGKEEFRCKCGKYCDGFPAQPERKLLLLADRVRGHFASPMIVSSGVRCQTHNANVGGASASRHMSGKAMDFTVRGKSAQDVLAFVQSQSDVRYAYAIDGNYVHMDIQ